jgi:hypothetical protein
MTLQQESKGEYIWTISSACVWWQIVIGINAPNRLAIAQRFLLQPVRFNTWRRDSS